MSTPEEDVIRAECEEWARGLHYPLTHERRSGLHERVCANPDGWWAVLKDLIVAAPDENSVHNLAFAPLRATLECGDGQIVEQAVSLAKTNIKMASALADGAPLNRDLDLISLLGRDYVAQVYFRRAVSKDPFDFWAWMLVNELLEADPPAAWTIILELIDKAPDDDILGYVAAGPLEDFIKLHAADYIDRIEACARTDARMKKALSGVWLSNLSADLLDRIEAAAGVPLDRP
jgi:hypothetical protein